LTLRIKPQISETGAVRLTIYQEASTIDASSVGTSTGLITNKRSIETNVVVDDGSVIVLGGLLSDTYGANKNQVPGAGDIPVLGWLFKNESRSRQKQNLMVFLRPKVVRDAAASDALSTDRYMQMMGLHQQAQPSKNAIIDTGGAPLLPALPVKPTPATPASTNPQSPPTDPASH
jgi:general secretion pathway protein D